MTNNAFDVIVIGSGFGGAVAANRLALAGKRVLVLERGPWRDSTPVRSMGVTRRSPFPAGFKAFTHMIHSVHRGNVNLRLNKAGMFELFVFSGVYALAASAVGGGSTAYGGILEKPRKQLFWHGHHPALNPADIDRYCDKVIDDLGGVRIHPDQPTPQSVWSQLPDPSAGRVRPADVQPHVAMLLPPEVAQAGTTISWGPAAVQRKYCAFDGDSFLGSPGGAKASVDFAYLAPVLGKGVTVRDLCEVISIKRARPVDGSGYLVGFKDLALGICEQVAAPQVVLAAGTLNTLRLLFAASQQSNGLHAMPALGRNFGVNGDLMAIWKQPNNPHSSFYSAPVLGAITVDGHGAPCIGAGSFAGLDDLPLPSFLKRILSKMYLLYAMGTDSGTASVTVANGNLASDYDYRSEPIYEQIRAAMRVIESESGNRVLAIGKPISPHMFGGARLGADAGQGVVDHRGEVYGNPDLFIADASALPASPGVPPAVTIASWAHHVADSMVQHP